MARPKTLNPSYCHHKATGRAFVTLNGQRHYLGYYDTQASRDEYARLIGEWIASGRQTLPTANEASGDGAPLPLAIAEMLDAFWQHAVTYFVDPDGNPAPSQSGYRQALSFVYRLYAQKPTAEFGPKSLKAVRQAMIDAKPTRTGGAPKRGEIRRKWSRQHINQQIARIRQVFKWAAENELIPVTTYQALATVGGLRKGKTTAPESRRVKPVTDEHIDAVLPFLSEHVKTMVRLQRLTGARGGELCILRTGDIDRSGPVWLYRPRRHKTQEHGHERIIRFGPQAQELLTPFLKLDPDAFLFSPAEAEAKRREEASRKRAESGTYLSCGNVPGSNRKRKPKRAPGPRYTKGSYALAIARACDRAFPLPDELARQREPVPGRTRQTRLESLSAWRARLGEEKWKLVKEWRDAHRFHPHQIRHATATKLRSEFGIDVAQTILGHQLGSTVTEVYAEANQRQANSVIAKIG